MGINQLSSLIFLKPYERRVPSDTAVVVAALINYLLDRVTAARAPYTAVAGDALVMDLPRHRRTEQLPIGMAGWPHKASDK